MPIDIGALRRGVEKYVAIQESFPRVDVSQDPAFQRSFNGFYRMRQRPANFYPTFFGLLELSKTEETTFEQILRCLHQQTGRVEASFASKLYATRYPEKPIIDQYVVANLNLRRPPMYARSAVRIEGWIRLYDALVGWYEQYLPSADGRRLVADFDRVVPHTTISEVKKVDFMLWQTR